MPTENANLTTSTLTSKQLLRIQLQEDMDRFVKEGKKITQCERHESAFKDHRRQFMTNNQRRIEERRERERAAANTSDT